jgi:hypothetical protein
MVGSAATIEDRSRSRNAALFKRKDCVAFMRDYHR